MTTRYRIHFLDNLEEIDLKGIPFQTLECCPLCNGSKIEDVSVLKGSLTSAWCFECGHLFHRVKPTTAWYQTWYTSRWDTSQTVDRPTERADALLRGITLAKSFAKTIIPWRPANASIFDFCRRIIKSNDAVLDIGCGYGQFLLPFKRAGCSVYGIELSPHRARGAGRLGIKTAPVGFEDLSEATFGRRFNLVYANHVIEHLHQPQAFLKAVQGVSEPGAWLFLAVPNVKTFFLQQDFFFALHVHAFSRQALLQLMQANGFEVHAFQESHELRVLARWTGNPEMIRDFEPEKTLASRDALQRWVCTRIFGPDYLEKKGQVVFAKARTLQKPVKHPYEVQISTARDPMFPKTIALTVPQSFDLPLEFVSETSPNVAPFWVK